MRFRLHSSKGQSLPELLITIVVIGILATVTTSYFDDAIPAAEQRRAISAANSINAAKITYSMRVSNAASLWSSASNDAARFLLIRDRIPYASSDTLSSFTPTGFTLTLGSSIDSKVSVTTSGGAAISY